jgi:hypothetical protein
MRKDGGGVVMPSARNYFAMLPRMMIPLGVLR